MYDFKLDTMTVKDLRDLRDRVDATIRAHIARSRIGPAPAAPLPDQEAINLERERDAWRAWKR